MSEVETAVEYLKANWVSQTGLEQLLQKQAKSAGFRSKKHLEELESYKVIYRPFKKITLNMTGRRIDDKIQSESLIDEELTQLISDDDHRMLLWRPRYIKCKPSLEESSFESPHNQDAVKSVVDEFLEKRWQSQENDDEMRPKLRRLQADPLSVIAFVMPRTPGGLKKEQALIDERKASHAYVLASSLVTNCTPRNVITSVEIGDTILVETIIANYSALDGSTRTLILETPCTKSYREAVTAGKALARLCELYVECREIVSNATK